MKRTALLFLIFFPGLCLSQRFMYVKAVAGNYRMADMKALQKELKAQLAEEGIPGKTMLSFPASLQGEFGVDFVIRDKLLRKHYVGGFINYTMTEGLIDYTDYSGSVQIRQTLKCVTLGAKASYILREDLSAYVKAGFSFSDMKLLTTTKLQGGASDSDEDGFEADGLMVEPGIAWTKNFHRLRFVANAGYALNLNGKTWDSGEGYLIDSFEEPLRIDGVGFGWVWLLGLRFDHPDNPEKHF